MKNLMLKLTKISYLIYFILILLYFLIIYLLDTWDYTYEVRFIMFLTNLFQTNLFGTMTFGSLFRDYALVLVGFNIVFNFISRSVLTKSKSRGKITFLGIVKILTLSIISGLALLLYSRFIKTKPEKAAQEDGGIKDEAVPLIEESAYVKRKLERPAYASPSTETPRANCNFDPIVPQNQFNGFNQGYNQAPNPNQGINPNYNQNPYNGYNQGYNQNPNNGFGPNYNQNPNVNNGFGPNYNQGPYNGYNQNPNNGFDPNYNPNQYNGYNQNPNQGYNPNYNQNPNMGYNPNYNQAPNNSYNQSANQNVGYNPAYTDKRNQTVNKPRTEQPKIIVKEKAKETTPQRPTQRPTERAKEPARRYRHSVYRLSTASIVGLIICAVVEFFLIINPDTLDAFTSGQVSGGSFYVILHLGIIIIALNCIIGFDNKRRCFKKSYKSTFKGMCVDEVKNIMRLYPIVNRGYNRNDEFVLDFKIQRFSQYELVRFYFDEDDKMIDYEIAYKRITRS